MSIGRPSADVPSLWDVAQRHGLRPQRSGRRIRALCPWCIDAGESPKKGRTLSGAGDIEGNPWICFRCEKKGNAYLIAAYYGDVEPPANHEPRQPRREPPKPPATPAENIEQGWRQILASATEDDMARVCAWAREVRRWPAEVAAAVSQMDDIAAPERRFVEGRQGVAIVRAAENVGRPLLIAIRDARGRVCQVARRWMEPGPPPPREDGKPGQKSMALSAKLAGDAESWGGIWVYGQIPEALQAAECGEPIVIVEGAPDYLATAAVLQVTGEPGIVLGSYNTSTTKALVKLLVRELGERGIVAPKVVLVPNIEPPRKRRDGTMPEHGVGLATFLEAAEVLRGRAGIYLAQAPLGDGQRSTDVADLLAREGTDRVAMLIRRAVCVHKPPVLVSAAADQIRDRVLDAIRDATGFRSVGGRRRMVILRVDAGAGKSYAALKAAAAVAAGDFRIPVNGRRPKKWDPDMEWPPRERSVVFACPDHKLGEAKVRELEELVPDTETIQIHGLLHYCNFATHVEDVFPAVGRAGICGRAGDDEQRCHLAEFCPGAMEPSAPRGTVTFCAHALLPSIKADLCIIDESPGVVTMLAEGKKGARPGISDETISTLYQARMLPRVKAWMVHRNPDAAWAARLFSEAIFPLAQRHAADVTAGRVEPYQRRIGGEELLALVKGDRDLERSLLLGFMSRRKMRPPAPFPSEARSGFHVGRHMPSRIAFGAMCALADWIWRLGDYHDDEGAQAQEEEANDLPILGQKKQAVDLGPAAPLPVVAVRLDTDGRWSLEVREIKELPDAPVVMLDATGDLTEAEYKKAYPGWDIVFRRLDVQGSAPATAVHVETTKLSRRWLLGDAGTLSAEAADRLRRTITLFATKVRAHHPLFEHGEPTEVAILTHMPIAQVLAGEGPLMATATGAEVRRVITDLEARRFNVKIGYFGLHDRGQNDWQDVDGLLVLGDPFGNLGDIEEDAKLLDLDAGRVSRARTSATCTQAVARARSIRRKPNERVVLMFAGKTPPEVPGVIWNEERLPDGALPGQQAADLGSLVLEVARVEGVIGSRAIELFDRKGTRWESIDLDRTPHSTVGRAMDKIIAQLGWGHFSVKTRDSRMGVAARSMDAINAWLAKHQIVSMATTLVDPAGGAAAGVAAG